MVNDQNSAPLWDTQFSPSAWKQIIFEAAYLSVIALVAFVLLIIVWWAPDRLALEVGTSNGREFQEFAIAWLAGTLGGAAFAIKWLHHSVGSGPLSEKNELGWNRDRILWRVFVPILSGIVAVAFYSALKSGILNLQIEPTANQKAFASAFGFIVGYFSDRAAAKLREVAYVLFGTREDPPVDDTP